MSPEGLAYGVRPAAFLGELARLDLPAMIQRAAARAAAAPLEIPLSLEAAAGLLVNRSAPPLGEILERARGLTDRSFGRSILIYAPCYLSSFCVNHCRYCGFNFTMAIPRRCLTPEEASQEIAIIAERGIRRLLLVAGDHPSRTTAGYIEQVIRGARDLVPEVDLEVAPGPTRFYRSWARAGAGGLVCYQETYDPDWYGWLHPRGPKRVYETRLGALERAGAAGMKRMGLGILLGLADPVRDLLALIAHARFLALLYPDASITMSLPRLQPAVPSFQPAYAIDDASLVRFYAVLRLAVPRAGLVVSTREAPQMRRRLLDAGVTQMSAGSVTVPGGYSHAEAEGGQFAVADRRSVEEVAADLGSLGYAVCWRTTDLRARAC